MRKRSRKWPEERVRHRLARKADHLQHLAGGGLLLSQNSVRSRVRCPNLVEQPNILDGDDGLVGKSLDPALSRIGKAPHDLPRQREYADGFSVALQGDTKVGPVAAEPLILQRHFALCLIGKEVHSLNGAAGFGRAGGECWHRRPEADEVLAKASNSAEKP